MQENGSLIKMEQLIKAKEFLNSKGIATAVIGMVLGTGLHQLLNYVDVKQTISYAEFLDSLLLENNLLHSVIHRIKNMEGLK